jgi:hypothetical protein
MEISDVELDKMYLWILDSMKENTWYPVKSDKAFETLVKLFELGLIDFCEFDSNQTHIRKIDQKLLEDEL